MNNKLNRQVFGINKDHIVVMVEDKTWQSSQQTRMTLDRAAYMLQELGVNPSSIDGDEDHENWLKRVKNLLSLPLTVNGKTFYIPPTPETIGVDPMWDWRELNPGWFEAVADGKAYGIGLIIDMPDDMPDDTQRLQVEVHGMSWCGYYFRQQESGANVCLQIMHQPRFGRLVEAQAWVESVHEQGKDKAGEVGG